MIRTYREQADFERFTSVQDQEAACSTISIPGKVKSMVSDIESSLHPTSSSSRDSSETIRPSEHSPSVAMAQVSLASSQCTDGAVRDASNTIVHSPSDSVQDEHATLTNQQSPARGRSRTCSRLSHIPRLKQSPSRSHLRPSPPASSTSTSARCNSGSPSVRSSLSPPSAATTPTMPRLRTMERAELKRIRSQEKIGKALITTAKTAKTGQLRPLDSRTVLTPPDSIHGTTHPTADSTSTECIMAQSSRHMCPTESTNPKVVNALRCPRKVAAGLPCISEMTENPTQDYQADKFSVAEETPKVRDRSSTGIHIGQTLNLVECSAPKSTEISVSKEEGTQGAVVKKTSLLRADAELFIPRMHTEKLPYHEKHHEQHTSAGFHLLGKPGGFQTSEQDSAYINEEPRERRQPLQQQPAEPYIYNCERTDSSGNTAYRPRHRPNSPLRAPISPSQRYGAFYHWPYGQEQVHKYEHGKPPTSPETKGKKPALEEKKLGQQSSQSPFHQVWNLNGQRRFEMMQVPLQPLQIPISVRGGSVMAPDIMRAIRGGGSTTAGSQLVEFEEPMVSFSDTTKPINTTDNINAKKLPNSLFDACVPMCGMSGETMHSVYINRNQQGRPARDAYLPREGSSETRLRIEAAVAMRPNPKEIPAREVIEHKSDKMKEDAARIIEGRLTEIKDKGEEIEAFYGSRSNLMCSENFPPAIERCYSEIAFQSTPSIPKCQLIAAKHPGFKQASSPCFAQHMLKDAFAQYSSLHSSTGQKQCDRDPVSAILAHMIRKPSYWYDFVEFDYTNASSSAMIICNDCVGTEGLCEKCNKFFAVRRLMMKGKKNKAEEPIEKKISLNDLKEEKSEEAEERLCVGEYNRPMSESTKMIKSIAK
jgi:hypothetical protein